MDTDIGRSTPSVSVQIVFIKRGTFSNIKIFGLICEMILMDSTIREFLVISFSAFLWLATTEINFQK